MLALLLFVILMTDAFAWVVQVGRNGPERLHFVLFNDLLVYGQAKRIRNVLG